MTPTVEYYRTIAIENSLETLLIDKSEILDRQSLPSEYFCISYRKNRQVKQIDHIRNQVLYKSYCYSHNNNLKSMIDYALSDKEIIKEIYTYPQQQRILIEKRFYLKDELSFLKKERYSKTGLLKEIVYYHEREIYCIEYFEGNELDHVHYFNKQGLQVM